MANPLVGQSQVFIQQQPGKVSPREKARGSVLLFWPLLLKFVTKVVVRTFNIATKIIANTDKILRVGQTSSLLVLEDLLGAEKRNYRNNPWCGLTCKIYLEYNITKGNKNITSSCIQRNIPLNIMSMSSSWLMKSFLEYSWNILHVKPVPYMNNFILLNGAMKNYLNHPQVFISTTIFER